MKFREYVQENGHTQQYFSEKLGVSKNHINALYHERSTPAPELMVEIYIMTQGAVDFIDWLSKDNVKRYTNIKKGHNKYQNR